MRLGKNMKNALSFYARQQIYGFAGTWNTFNLKDKTTRSAIESLVKLGLIEIHPEIKDMARATNKACRIATKLLIA